MPNSFGRLHFLRKAAKKRVSIKFLAAYILLFFFLLKEREQCYNCTS